MNTNSSKTKKGLCLFLFSLVFYPLVSFSSINIEKNLLKNQEVLFPLNLTKNSYIKGTYKVSFPIYSIDLLDKNKKFIRRIDRLNKFQHSFYFLTYNSSEFYVKIRNKNKINKINIKIEKNLPATYKKEEEKKYFLSPIIKEQSKKLLTDKNTKAFWEKVKKVGTPLVENIKGDNYIITFLYKGAKHNVRLLGGPIADHVYLKKLGHSDIWYKSFKVKKGIKMSYQLAPDVPNIKGTFWEKRVAILSTAQADPFNKMPYKFVKDSNLDKYSKMSTFEILKDNFVDWTTNQNSPKGKIINTKIKSKILGDSRNITIYTPYKYNYKKEHQLLFVFDGVAYQQKIPTPRILDNLIEKKKILPTIAIFINNPSSKARATQLPPNKKFADFMAKELLVFIEKKVKINHKAKNTILTGSSYGGLASMYIAFTYPNIFGNVLSQSGSFWWAKDKKDEPEWLTRKIAQSVKKDIKIYLNAGIYETGHLPMDILESNRHLRTVLISKGYKNISYEEFQNSHDYFAWRANLANGLIKLSQNK